MTQHREPQTIEHRLGRIEAKLTQLMIHMGLPHDVKTYYNDSTNSTNKGTECHKQLKKG